MTTKVSSAMQDLTDDYAFSGTVSGAGKVVQVVNVTDGAVATGTVVAVDDDSIMQISEGDQYMSLAITPTSASNKLLIHVNAHSFNTIASAYATIMGLFNTDYHATNSMATTYNAHVQAHSNTHSLTHFMTAPSASATTFKVRIGTNGAGTTTFNGNGGARLQGGVMASSITIWEIAV